MRKILMPILFFLSVGVLVSCSKDEVSTTPEEKQARPLVKYEVVPGDDPFTFKFENTSSNYAKLEWRFGDDSLSTEVSPTHVFPRNGKFEVTLKATAADGSTAMKLYVVDIAAESVGKISAKPTATPNTVKFTVNTLMPVKSVSWDFGDGKKSTELSPEKAYEAGKLFTARALITTEKGSVAEVIKLVGGNGSVNDVTLKYLLNPGPKFATAARFGSRWGIVKDWRVNDAVKQRDGGMGGWDEWDGNSMSMESWGGEPDIVNGKIEQTSIEPLAAGTYYYTLDFVGYQWKDQMYVTIAKGNELPDVDKVETSPNVLAFSKRLGSTPTNFTTSFVNPTTGNVTFGFVATFIQPDQYFRLRSIKLYQLDL